MNADHPFIQTLKDTGDGQKAWLTDAGRDALFAKPQQWLDLLENAPAGRLVAAQSQDLGDQFSGHQWPHFFAVASEQGGEEHAPTKAKVLARLNPDLSWLTGHFPGQPVLPGVVQTHWAGLLGKKLVNIPGQFSALNVVKFQQVMQPGRAFMIHLDYAIDRGVLKFHYEGTQGLFSQGRITFSAAC